MIYFIPIFYFYSSKSSKKTCLLERNNNNKYLHIYIYIIFAIFFQLIKWVMILANIIARSGVETTG